MSEITIEELLQSATVARAYAQKNVDSTGCIVPLADQAKGVMQGTDAFPVYKLLRIYSLGITKKNRLDSSENFKLRFFMGEKSQRRLPVWPSYYMQFVFHDFYMIYYLFLYNAIINHSFIVPNQSMNETVTSKIVDVASLGDGPAYAIHAEDLHEEKNRTRQDMPKNV